MQRLANLRQPLKNQANPDTSQTTTYKGKPVDVKQIGRELGVRYLLEGSVVASETKSRSTPSSSRCSLNCDFAPAASGQDRQDRWRGFASRAARPQARRTAGLFNGSGADA
jgi:hypothetical protein